MDERRIFPLYSSILPFLLPPTPPPLNMLIRIVRMTFRPGAVDTFLEHFDRVAPSIRAFGGCEHLELWQDLHAPTRCTTYSLWRSEQALEAYRESELFRSTWSVVKPLFAAPPHAFSSRRLRGGGKVASTTPS